MVLSFSSMATPRDKLPPEIVESTSSDLSFLEKRIKLEIVSADFFGKPLILVKAEQFSIAFA